jgi:hypothetical protein
VDVTTPRAEVLGAIARDAAPRDAEAGAGAGGARARTASERGGFCFLVGGQVRREADPPLTTRAPPRASATAADGARMLRGRRSRGGSVLSPYLALTRSS